MDDSRLSVLHLVGLEPGGDDPGSLELVRGLMKHDLPTMHRTLVAGSSHHARHAEQAGLRLEGHVPAPRAFGGSGERALRRFIGDAHSSGVGFDILQAWTVEAAELAFRAAPKMPLITSLVTDPSGSRNKSKRPPHAPNRPANFVAFSEGIRERWAGRLGDSQAIEVIRPGVADDAPDASARETIRASWAAGDDTIVVGVLSDPAAPVDARDVATMAIRLDTDEYRLRFCLPPGALALGDALRMVARQRCQHRLFVDDRLALPRRVAAGLDIALAPYVFSRPKSSCEPSLQALQLMADGLPTIVASMPSIPAANPDSGVAQELMEAGSIAEVCERLLRLDHDDELRRRYSEICRAYVKQNHPWPDFVASLDAYHRRIASAS